MCFIVCVMLRIYLQICRRIRWRKRDPDLNGEKDIRLDEIREEHWRGVDDEGNDKKKIHFLR